MTNMVPLNLPDIYDDPTGMSLTAISGTPEWRRLKPMERRAIALAVDHTHGDLIEAVRLAHSRDPHCNDAAAETERMLLNLDVKAVIAMYSTPTKEKGVRQS